METENKRTERSIPWVEKYRPKSLDEVVLQTEVTSTLKKSMSSGNLPHLLFYGPAGTGKTSCALAIARELYGPELMKSRIKELNASDERGIRVVREKIKDFAKVSVTNSSKYKEKYPCPPYKLIILDEADAMSKEAQSALRRVMENHSKVTRFVLICNYVSKILDPIASRCAKFRFKPLQGEQVVLKLQDISRKENIDIERETLDSVWRFAQGDMRKAISLLQSAKLFHEAHESIALCTIKEISGVVPDQFITKLDESVHSLSFEEIQQQTTDLIASGYSASQIVTQYHQLILQSKEIDGMKKAKVSLDLAVIDDRLSQGGDEYIQLLGALSTIQNRLKN